MMRKMTIDSSVIIASLLEKEPRHSEALEIWNSILSGENIAIMPYSVFVEVVAAIKRRTGSEALALEIKDELLNTDTISFVILDDKSALEAAEIAAKSGVRGMDALLIQTSKEFETELISFDEEMMQKSKIILNSSSSF
ncbi:MAG: type II toxin-antitoxin system VapC family toxin [bacterium]